MTKSTGGDQTGSVAEEAAKLFAALRCDSQAHEGISRECQWCPVCQVIRRVGPDVVEQVVASVRGLLDALSAAAAAAREAGTPPGAAKEEPSKVDRIDVSEDPERWD